MARVTQKEQMLMAEENRLRMLKSTLLISFEFINRRIEEISGELRIMVEYRAMKKGERIRNNGKTSSKD